MNDFLYDTLSRLIAFDTVSAKSDVRAAEFIADRLDGSGFKTALQKVDINGVPQCNLVASAGPARPGGLIISGHIDTVPFEGQPGWIRDPLDARVDGDRIYGRGTSDMKGFLAQCIAAGAALKPDNLKLPLIFAFTAYEEIGCLGAEKLGPELSSILGEVPTPTSAWIGEPTSWGIRHAHKSIVLFDVTATGRGGHSGAPAKGVNAIAVMGKVLEVIGKIQQERAAAPDPNFAEVFPESPTDVVNFGMVSGGIATNMIAEECRLHISYRSLPDSDPLKLYRDIEHRIAAIDTRDYAGGTDRAAIVIGSPMVVPPLLSPRETPLEQVLSSVIGTAGSRGAVFATDAGWFARAGITSLICGPGDFDQAHQPDESISREAFERGTGVILSVVDRMCVGGAP